MTSLGSEIPAVWKQRGSVGKPWSAVGRRSPHLVELLVKLAELGHLLHHLLAHEEGGVHRSVALGEEALQRVLDERLLQEHQGTLGTKRNHLKREQGTKGSPTPSQPFPLSEPAAAPVPGMLLWIQRLQHCSAQGSSQDPHPLPSITSIPSMGVWAPTLRK